jgi:hypothetical protein
MAWPEKIDILNFFEKSFSEENCAEQNKRKNPLEKEIEQKR